jgi:DNA-binding SARP family transcriptional activator
MFCCVLGGGAAVLSVSLLGASRVTRGNEQIWLDLGPAGRRLAGFLFTFPDRPHRRERLIDLFWPELEVERGRRAVNSAIWRLRKLLSSAPEYKEGDRLRTVGPETILERTPWLDVDTWALLEAAQAALGRAEAHMETSGMQRLLAVLYRCELARF